MKNFQVIESNVTEMDLRTYKAKTQNAIDLMNPKHVIYVSAALGYNEKARAKKSRVICLMRILSKPENLAAAQRDNVARGCIKALITAILRDGTKISFTKDKNILFKLPLNKADEREVYSRVDQAYDKMVKTIL